MLRGFRLGTSIDEVQRRFPGVQFTSYSSLGVSTIVLSPVKDGYRSMLDGRSVRPYSDSNVFDTAQFPGFDDVSKIKLSFVQGEITTIEITYKDDEVWRNADDFINAVTAKLNIPNAWGALESKPAFSVNGSEMVSEFRTMQCIAFQVRISVDHWRGELRVLNPTIQVTNAAVEEEAKEAERKQGLEAERKEKEKRREAFKP